jgi:hypothetical protein|nr:MAG TPA: Portal protein [Bacteriophage sp.]
MAELWKQLDAIDLANAKLRVKQMRTIEKAIRSDSPDDILRAQKALNTIQQKENQAMQPKAFFIDPLEFNSNLGYKDKSFSLSYTTLKRMSKTPIINSIIKTRKNQVADFAEPQENKYSTGFVVRKKSKNGVEQNMDNKDKRIAFAITDFLLKGGNVGEWEHDDFDTFIRKIVDDSLTYDQMTFEIMRNRRGKVESFVATDAATFRMANSFFAKDYDIPYFSNDKGLWGQDKSDYGPKIKGYYPAYVQVYQNVKVSEFYPWELCFGIRNPSTSIFANGYGCSELEELINVVTSLLWGDEYNRRFFSQGSAPKGMLRVKGAVNETALQQFKQQWQSMITGVMQSWKTPVVNQDVEWIDLQKNNRDMEYSSWMEYLIKIACAIFNIDPIEIGWDISRSSGRNGLFEGGQGKRLQNSKNKGLYPLLKFLQRKINKYIVEQIHPDYEFVFMGLNGMTIDQELDLDIKKVQAFATINEIREKYEMKPLEGGDVIENAVFVQSKNAAVMGAQGGDLSGGGAVPTPDGEEEEAEPENPFDLYAEGDEEETEDEDTEKAQNSFVKAFDAFLEKELNN